MVLILCIVTTDRVIRGAGLSRRARFASAAWLLPVESCKYYVGRENSYSLCDRRSGSSIHYRPLYEIFMGTRSDFASIGELDQLREFATGAELEIVQLCPGQMTGVLAHCDLERSSLHLNKLSLPARGRGVLSANRWTFVVFPERTQGRFNCVTLSSEVLLAFPPKAEFQGTIASGFHDWVFTVDFDELSQAYAALYQTEMRMRCTGFQLLRPDPSAMQALRTLGGRTLEQSRHSPQLFADADTRSNLHAQLLELLAASIHSASHGVRRNRRAQRSRWQVVRQAEDFMRAHADQPISMTTLCGLTNMHERSLRRAFHDVVGVSPTNYLTAIRMNRARAELERAAPKPWTRTDGNHPIEWGDSNVSPCLPSFYQHACRC